MDCIRLFALNKFWNSRSSNMIPSTLAIYNMTSIFKLLVSFPFPWVNFLDETMRGKEEFQNREGSIFTIRHFHFTCTHSVDVKWNHFNFFFFFRIQFVRIRRTFAVFRVHLITSDLYVWAPWQKCVFLDIVHLQSTQKSWMHHTDDYHQQRTPEIPLIYTKTYSSIHAHFIV